MKRFIVRRVLACLLMGCILFLSAGAAPVALEEAERLPAALSAEGHDLTRLTLDDMPPSLVQKVEQGKEQNQKEPVSLDPIDADDPYSLTTVNEDGSRSIYSFTTPIKYVDSETNQLRFTNNDWQEVGLVDSLFSELAYTKTDGSVRTAVPKDIQDGVLVEWEAQAEETLSAKPKEYTFRMTPEGDLAAAAVRKEGSSFVTYQDPFGEGTRLEYQATASGIKENLILEENPGVSEFAFVVEAPGLIPDVPQGGEIRFLDEKTKGVAVTVTQPWAMDSADSVGLTVQNSQPHFCPNLEYKVESLQKHGYYRLILVVDPAFLSDPSTVYPITIDPNISVEGIDIPHATLFSDGRKWTNDLGGVGTVSGAEMLMYFKVPNVPQYKYINPAKISDAFILLEQALGSETGYYVDLHDSNTNISIDNATYNSVLANIGTRIDNEYCTTNDTDYVWEFTGLFQAWLNLELSGSSWSEYQFIIKARTTGNPYKYFNATGNYPDSFFYLITYTEDTSISNGYYYLQNVSTSDYLDHVVSDNRTTVWDLDGMPKQRWKITRNSDGTYSIKPGDNNSLGLEVYYDSDTNEQPITQYTYDTTDKYKWRIIQNTDGTYRIMPMLSKTRGLDVYGDSDTTKTFNGRSFPKRNGIDVQLFNYVGSSNQKWVLKSLDDAVTATYMSNLAGTSTYYFNTAAILHNGLGSSAPHTQFVDSSSTEVWELMKVSDIFMFSGHGLKASISCGGGTSRLTRDYILSQPVDSLNCQLVIYNTCLTGEGGENAANLAQATVDRGAITVVAFSKVVNEGPADYWCRRFSQYLLSGYTIENANSWAIDDAANAYGENVGDIDSAIVFGNKNQTLS